ncbi:MULTISPECIES: oleate hydratase [Liquorilactobacillus]|uniref:oleate hydratase n=1 Tax=Liquorilactobacillus TaxID=2767888 RepID=UPI0021C312C7|nr:oleate hydratase [Liquorilactobacillus satsumensis]MCP9328681.1 oleate hydratase [Liquorilactobacillus satsumensis]
MRQYDNIRSEIPENIDKKKAHIIGGGIAGLANAVFLIDDGYMSGKNITIYEKLPVVGGSMDAADADHNFGYTCRGERELEPNMECLWYLCSKIESVDSPGMTILEETVAANKHDLIDSKTRILWKQGKTYPKTHSFKMSAALSARLGELIQTPEEIIEDVTIDEFFGDLKDEWYASTTWICFHTMLAFKNYHSVIEMKRYLLRFIQHMPGIDHLQGILHTKYNEYDSIIKPVKKWLEDKGVNIITDFSVYDLNMDSNNNEVLAIKAHDKDGKDVTIDLDTANEFVVLTSGSMTTNSTYGDNTTVAITNRDTADRGVFTIWENLAKKDAKFGKPEKFISDVDKTKWMSACITIKGYPEFYDRIYKMTKNKPDTQTGAISIQDSNWDISMCFYPKYFADQKDDENVFWFDTLYGENNGDYIKKPSSECTGEEMVTELLYHLGVLDMKDDLLAHSYISTCMMPYITSQFMPRKISDRPSVVPEGCTNLALIGQYVELPGDVVFTVETSVRTAMMGAYDLLGLTRPVLPIYEAQYDTRILVASLKKMLDTDEIKLSDLPKINPLKIASQSQELLKTINNTPTLDINDAQY